MFPPVSGLMPVGTFHFSHPTTTTQKGEIMLELYILETCPYSRKVMKYFDEHNIKYKKHDIQEPENLEKLMKLGGEQQVPFLYDLDNNVKMYESDDIIEYAKKL